MLFRSKESINERLAIYRENPNAAFDIGDFAWWASTRKKQELTQHGRHMISAIIFLWNDLHNVRRHGPCIETATRMSHRLYT